MSKATIHCQPNQPNNFIFFFGQKNSDFIFNPNKHAIMHPHDNRLIPESKQLAGD